MKEIFLIDKARCSDEELKTLTQTELEEWAASENYEEDFTIMAIYPEPEDTIESAVCRNMGKYWWDNYRHLCHIVSY